MQKLYCWRCKVEVAMLDETEFKTVAALFPEGIAATTALGAQPTASIRGSNLQERVVPALDAYHRITGFRESNPNALGHHRLSLYGSPCPGCGRPFRTPRAQFCAACGWLPGVAAPP